MHFCRSKAEKCKLANTYVFLRFRRFFSGNLSFPKVSFVFVCFSFFVLRFAFFVLRFSFFVFRFCVSFFVFRFSLFVFRFSFVVFHFSVSVALRCVALRFVSLFDQPLD